MAKDASINLLRKQQKTAGFHVFLEWLLTYGRIIIIVVQTIALAGLVYRYTLDKELETIQLQIEEKQTAIQEREQEEKMYRNLHERLTIIETTNDSSAKTKDFLMDVVTTASGYLVFNKISLENNTMRMEAYTSSVALINTFIKSLRDDDRVGTINIGSIESDSSSAQIAITLSVSIKTGALGKNAL